MGISVENTAKPFVTAIVLAAGNSTRMGTNISKQFIPIGYAPVIVHTLKAFISSDFVDEIIIAAREEDIGEIYRLIKSYSLTKVNQIVNGGATRQESVINAVKSADKHSEFFAIHDGARPLVTPQVIDRTICDAFERGAAAAGVPVKDTIKLVDENGIIISTPNREMLWSAQTPQVFERNLYLQAMEKAIEDGVSLTDDCQLVERTGKPVYMSEGDYTNIKITTPEDISIAQMFLELRSEDI